MRLNLRESVQLFVVLTIEEMLIREKQVCDGVEVNLTPTRHRKYVRICFGFLKYAEYFSILLDELLALLSLVFNRLLFSSEDAVAVGVTAEACMVWVHIGARVDFSQFLLVEL